VQPSERPATGLGDDGAERAPVFVGARRTPPVPVPMSAPRSLPQLQREGRRLAGTAATVLAAARDRGREPLRSNAAELRKLGFGGVVHSATNGGADAGGEAGARTVPGANRLPLVKALPLAPL
jgi:hypothetical protein